MSPLECFCNKSRKNHFLQKYHFEKVHFSPECYQWSDLQTDQTPSSTTLSCNDVYSFTMLFLLTDTLSWVIPSTVHKKLLCILTKVEMEVTKRLVFVTTRLILLLPRNISKEFTRKAQESTRDCSDIWSLSHQNHCHLVKKSFWTETILRTNCWLSVRRWHEHRELHCSSMLKISSFVFMKVAQNSHPPTFFNSHTLISKNMYPQSIYIKTVATY